MNLLSSIGFSIVGYFVLMFVTTNLTGMVVRGFFRDAQLEELKKDKRVHSFIKQEITKSDRADNLVTIISFIIGILFLVLLYRYLNIWAVVAALLLIVSRIPDLVWEIRNGKKVTKEDRPKGGIYSVTDVAVLVALPVFWWSLYNL